MGAGTDIYTTSTSAPVCTGTSGYNGFNWTLSPVSAGSINSSTGEVTWNPSFSGTATVSVYAIGCGSSPTVGTQNSSIRTTDVTVNPSCNFTWNGTQSANWNDPLNWTPNGTPNTCSADVSIPSGTPNNPSITASNIQVGNLSISATASLNITTGRVLNVCKDWTGGSGSSADVTGDGRVILNGTVAQDINGNTNFSVLRLNNGLGATLNGNATISQMLELENGTFTTTGTRLTFLSPNENSCGIADNFSPGFLGTISGPVVAQRGHVASVTYAQHYMSSPVNNASFTNFVNPSGANGVAVTPTANCDETTLQTGSNYGAAFEWNQALGASCMLAGWVVRSTGTMENGKGYSLIPKANPSLVSGNLNFNASYSQTNLSDANWTNTSLQTRPYNSGWHLVGNPYLAYLDPSGATNTDFDNIGGVWHTNGTFAGTYQPLSLSSSDVVAPFQAFMVHKSTPAGSSTFTVNATERRSGSATFYKSNLYALSLLVNGNGYNDITYIDFDPNATTNFDAQFDGYKLPGRIDQPALFSLENRQWLSVQTNPDVASKPIIPLGFMAGADGQFSITADGADAIQNTQVFLKDNKTGTRHNLTIIPSYSFAGLTTDVTNRFELQFEFKNTLDPNSINNLNDEIAISIYPIPAKDVIVFKTEDSKHLKVELVSVEGKKVANFDFVGETTYDLSTISAGVYMAYITDEANNKIVKRIVKE
jgi:hypothetical protein